MEAAGVLSVAFGLGLLLHASQTAFFTAISGHIKTLLLHRRRLVLLSFLLCVSVFSITQFATLLLLEDGSCEVAVRFTLFFDQAARVTALALVVWKVCDEASARNEAVVWVSVVLLRMLVGGFMVGFTGIAFIPVCFPRPMHVVVGIVHTAFDGTVWAVLGWRIIAIWMLFVDQGRGGGNGGGKSQGYGLFLIVLGFMGWTIGSFPYMMNVGGSIFIRMIPYILTLALALGVLSCFPSIAFSVPVKTDDYRLQRFGSSAPSATRRGRSVSSPNFNPDMEANKLAAYGVDSRNGVRASQMFRSIIGAPIVHPGNAIPWPLDTGAAGITRPKPTKSVETRRPSLVPSHGGKPSISGPTISGPIGPILRSDVGEGTAEGVSPINPFGRMKTVDLKTAAEAERQRINAAFEREQQQETVTPSTAQSLPLATPNGSVGQSTSVKRRPLVPSGPAAYRVSVVSGLRGTPQEIAADSPSSLRRSVDAVAEGSDWGMRCSTRANSVSTEDDGCTVVSHAPYSLAAPPRIPQLEGIQGDAKVMFVNEIVYDYPALVNSIVESSIVRETDVALSTSRYSQPTATTTRRSPSSATKRLPGILTPAREVDEPFVASSSSAPVMERPRNVKKEPERGIFPPNRDFALAAEMKYKKRHLAMTIENASDLPLLVPPKPLFSPPAQKAVVKKPSREIVFPIPPVRVNTVRKPAPPPISITIPVISSPEIVQQAPTPDAGDSSEKISSTGPVVLERSERRLAIGINRNLTVDKEADENATYETTKAWTDSLFVTEEVTRSPHSIIEPLPSIAYKPESNNSPTSSVSISGFTAGTILHRSLISLTSSPKVEKEDEEEFTDIDIDSGSEISEGESIEYGSDEQTLSEADEMIMSGGEGYSSEESFEEDCFTDSDEGRPYLDDGVVISDVEDGTTYDKIALAERKLNAKMRSLTTDSLPGIIPGHFQIGDRIPTFSESRHKYGSRRKPPPSPIGFLMRQRRESQQRIQARLTMLAGGRTLAPMEDLMNRLPANSKRDTRVSYASEGRNSLIARLEMEMDQQESEWMNMHQDLRRSSIESSSDDSTQKPARLSQSITQRRSLLARLNSGIDRRRSAQTTMTSDPDISLASVPDAWQNQLIESQMEYLAQAPFFPGNVAEMSLKPIPILASQHTPSSTVSGSEFDHSEVGSPLSIQGEVQRRSFYQNDNSNFVIEEADGGDAEEVEVECDEEEDEDEGGEGEEEEEEDEGEGKVEEEGEKGKYHDGEVIQPLQATVYCPSIRSASVQTPAKTCCSSTTEAFSPRTKFPVSLLWNPRVPQETTSETNQLWSYYPLAPKPALVFPPAVDLRPKQRISTTPLEKSTTNLWTKPHLARSSSVTGLWRGPKDARTKSIIISTTGRTRRSLERVTFVEEAVTVEPTGLFGKLRELWGAPKKTFQAATEAPVIPAISQAPKAQDKPIKHVMDAIAIVYASKVLPPLPVQESKESTKHAQSITRNTLWSKEENVALTASNTKLWDPTQNPPPKPSQAVFTKDVSEIRAKPRAAALPALESSNLWGMVETKVSTTLWTNPRSGHLWPQGPPPATPPGHLWPSASSLPAIEFSSPRFKRPASALSLAPLESTDLWEAVREQKVQYSTRLWSGGSTGGQDPCSFGSGNIRTFDYLWPTAASLPASPLIVSLEPCIRSHPWATLEVLESHELWQPPSAVAAQRLWVAPAKKSALWPQGEVTKSVGDLWPSAASLPLEIQMRPRSHRAPSTLALATLESPRLWKPADVGLEQESTGLWPVRSDVPRDQELYFQEPVQICKSDYLWPTAPLPASYLAVDILPPVRSRSPTPVLVSLALTSRKLWQPASDITAPRLWSAPAKKSALWPQGEVTKSVGDLWPSAASLPLEIQMRPRSHRAPSALALATLESARLWKPANVGLEQESTGLWPVRSDVLRDQELYFQEPVQICKSDYLWPTAPLPASYLAVDILPPVRSRSSAPVLVPLALTSRKLWQPASDITAPRLWSTPAKKSALWPQGEVSISIPGSLWPSAASLPLEIHIKHRSHKTPSTLKPAVPLESVELWKAATIRKEAESTGLWTARSDFSRDQKLCIQESVQARTPDYLWPAAASLSDSYLAMGTTPPVRSRPSTISHATLTSHELWQASVPAPSLWTAPVKKSSLWPRGEIVRPVPGSLWPSAASLPLEICVGHRSHRAPSTLELAPLESVELWKEVVVRQEVEPSGLWSVESNLSRDQKLCIQKPVQTHTSGYLWPAAASLSDSYLAIDRIPFRSRPSTITPAALTSHELWQVSVPAPSLWTAPTKKSPLWPQGEIVRPVPGSLWPSAASLPLEICVGHRSHRAPSTLELVPLESVELWKEVAIRQEVEPSGLWSVRSDLSHDQKLCIQEPVQTHTSNYLWPAAASLPDSYLAIDTPPFRPRPPTVTPAVLTSHELWQVPAPALSLWTAPTKRSPLWPQGEIARSTPRSLWPSAAPLPFEIHVGRRSHRAPLALAPEPLESTKLWKTIAVTLGLWTAVKKSALWPHGQLGGPAGYLWPSAPDLCLVVGVPSGVRARSRATPLIYVAPTGLWTPQRGVKAWSVERGGLWSGGKAEVKVDMEIEGAEEKEEEEEEEEAEPEPEVEIESEEHAVESVVEGEEKREEDEEKNEYGVKDEKLTNTKLWAMKSQNIRITPSGYLWPSAHQLPASTPPLLAPARSRPTPLQKFKSTSLWPSKPSQATLWSPPTRQLGLWPSGKPAKTALWPSARPLPTLTLPPATHRSHAPTVLESHLRSESTKGLWTTEMAPRPGRQSTRNLRTETATLAPRLWTAGAIKNGLWPEGRVNEIVTGLWPSAGLLPSLPMERVVHIRHVLGDPAVLESRELWNTDSRPAALWAKSKSMRNGLWPEGKEEVTSEGLWHAPDNERIVRRPNNMLKVTVGEERAVKRKNMASAIKVVSGELWSWKEPRLEPPVWLLKQEIKACSGASPKITELGTAAVTPGITPAASSLWIKPSLIPDTQRTTLWQPKAVTTIEARSRFNIDNISPRRKTVQPATSSLQRAHSTLWSSPLPDASRQHIWAPAPRSGLWSANGTTASLVQINTPKNQLWNKHGGACTPAFAHRPMASRSARHTRLSVPLEAATGSLWLSAGDQDTVVRCGSSHQESRGLAFVCLRPVQALLWYRHDKPPAVPVPIPAAIVPVPVPPSRSQPVNKRASSITAVLPPLFLAPLQAPSQIGHARKPPSFPRGLWREPISGTKGPPRPSKTTPALAPTAESQLWSKSHSGTSIFSDTTQSIRSVRKPETPMTISMEGQLWKSPDDSTPSLWRKKDKPSALWSVDGAETSMPAPVAKAHLWCENPTATAPIFLGLSLESSRSRREFTHKTFSAPPDGLWEKVNEPVVEPSTGLWGTNKAPIPNKALSLWQKDNTAAPMFADLPVESYRSKKDHSTITLPVFSEGMWKKHVTLPETPQLWKPTPKLTYLWDSGSKTKTLAQMLLEKKAKEIKKPLWTKCQASRTTTKAPQRSLLVVVRTPNDTALPKVSGSLWKPKTAAQQPPKLWTPKAVTKVPKPAGTPLWTKEHAARTTGAVPERTKVAFIPSDTPLPVVGGTLWRPKSPEAKIGLWQRPIKTVAIYRCTSVSASLWAKETASRTTTARPERHTFVPKKKASTTLNKASGSLWQPKVTLPDGLWGAAPRPRRISLWAKYVEPQVAPVRTSVPKHIIDPPLPVVSGELWHQQPVEDTRSLWKLPVEAPLHRTTSALWSKELASRTTTARPSRAPFTPKPVSKSHILPAATGDLWKAAPTAAPLTLWTRKPAASGVWDAEGRTPSLAEINRRLKARQDSLWQRRSVRTSKAVYADADPAAKPFAPKKKFDTSTASVFGNLWQPVSPVIQSSVMWIARSSHSSSVDDEYLSPNLSRASTLSDLSDGEVSPMAVEHGFEPQIARVHSTKASISSSAGESLWRPAEEYGKKKELTLWSSEAREERRSIFASERPVKIALPGIGRERELPMFDASHSLWKPNVQETKTIWTNHETICDSDSETDFHDAESYDESSFHDAESDFHDAASQISDDSHYEDFEHISPQASPEPGHSPAEQPHVVVGQFRRSNYLPHSPSPDPLAAPQAAADNRPTGRLQAP